MTLALSGVMSLGGSTSERSINLELGRSATATISMNEADVRGLADITSGAISLSNFHGKSDSVAGTLSGTGSLSLPANASSITWTGRGGTGTTTAAYYTYTTNNYPASYLTASFWYNLGSPGQYYSWAQAVNLAALFTARQGTTTSTYHPAVNNRGPSTTASGSGLSLSLLGGLGTGNVGTSGTSTWDLSSKGAFSVSYSVGSGGNLSYTYS